MLVERQQPDYLYLVCLGKAGKLFVFDCKGLLHQSHKEVRFLNTIEVQDGEGIRLFAGDSGTRGF